MIPKLRCLFRSEGQGFRAPGMVLLLICQRYGREGNGSLGRVGRCRGADAERIISPHALPPYQTSTPKLVSGPKGIEAKQVRICYVSSRAKSVGSDRATRTCLFLAVGIAHAEAVLLLGFPYPPRNRTAPLGFTGPTGMGCWNLVTEGKGKHICPGWRLVSVLIWILEHTHTYIA